MARLRNKNSSKRRGSRPAGVKVAPAKSKAVAGASVDHVTGEKIPKSFVFRRGKLPATLRRLEQDLRRLMLPYTALKLREKKRNNLKDFLNVSGPMGVSHFLILSNPKSMPHLRVAKTPQGPTLTFEVHEYSLVADIAKSQANPGFPAAIFRNSPLIVLSGFGNGGQHLKLATVMFRNMFPTIDAKTVKLSSCQRIVLLNYDPEKKLIDFRHYFIRLQPIGVNRRIRKLVQNNKVPDLRNLKDVSDFITKAGYGSESEADEAATVSLQSDIDKINKASRQSSVKLHEIGPRLTLRLVKVEEGLCSGNVIFSEGGAQQANQGSGGERSAEDGSGDEELAEDESDDEDSAEE